MDRTRVVTAGALMAVLAAGAGLSALAVGREPGEFTDRTALPSCGEPVHQEAGEFPASADACLTAGAASGRGAELVVVTTTDEGDAITSYYRAVPGRAGLEVLVDGREDSYGSGGWSSLQCPDATGIVALGETCIETTL